MRYKSIELHNYAGIYNGMGLTQIKIDFTKCITNKIIIKGKNGSGKSTLLNAIHPNPDTNDNFIPNAEARKIIVLSDNGIDYIIRYIHPVTNSGRGTTKGYVSKCINGQMVELNPNGNISSCKDILYNELNLDANYLSLARLTSENRGLVDSRPAERKKLVNSIIHNLDTYNNIFKTLSKKSSTFKSLINSLTYKIDYIGNEAQLSAKLSNITGRLASLEKDKEATIECIAAVKLKISDIVKTLKDANYDDIKREIKNLDSEIKILKNSITTQQSKYGIGNLNNLKSFIDNLLKTVIEMESKRDALKNRVPAILMEKESEFKELQSKQQKLNSLQSDYNYLDIKQVTDQARSIVEDHEKIFAEMRLANVNLITKDEFNSAMEALKYLKTTAFNMISLYDITDISYVVMNRIDASNKIASIKELKIKFEEYKSKYSEIDKEYNIFCSKREIAEELSNRPKDCIIDSCPYIESAINADRMYPLSKMKELENSLAELSCEISAIDCNITKYELYAEILTNISSIERELNSKWAFIKKLPVRSDFKDVFLQRLINMDNFNDIDDLYKFVDCGNMIEEYRIAKEQLQKYEAEYKLYESKNIIIESILSDVESLNNKLDTLNNELEISNASIVELEDKIIELNTTISKLRTLDSLITDEYIPIQMQKSDLENTRNSLDNYSVEMDKLQSQLSELSTNLAGINSDIQALSSDKESINHSLIMLADYKVELAKYQDSYTKIEKLKYYSSSSTGIQTIYMQMYMNNVLSTANNLLSLLFDGEFVLQPFIINEQEFKIPCLGSGLMHDDISSMSTAQKSMISMILSYSILNQSVSRYNIISLDEMDGSLDGSNRSFFMTLLDKLMSILRCEQCFIISHNSELISELADVIILKDAPNANYGGNVIWRY